MYSLALRGRVRGFECINLLILRQLHSVSYKASDMGHGSSYPSCWFGFCCLCNFRSLVKVCLYVVALCRIMTPANASGKVVVGSCEWYMFMCFLNLAFEMGSMRRPCGAWSSNESKDVG